MRAGRACLRRQIVGGIDPVIVADGSRRAETLQQGLAIGRRGARTTRGEEAFGFGTRTQPSGDTSPGFGLPANGATLIPATSGIIGGGPSWSVLGGSSGGCYSAGCGYTGWIQSQYEIAASGDYYLSFGTINWLDQAFDTGLAIDNVTIKNVEVPQDTPEPATMALVAAGLAGLGVVRRRRRAA